MNEKLNKIGYRNVLLGIVFSIIVRIIYFPIQLGDYRFFLKEWWDFINQNGKILALKNQIGDYSPPYIFLLSIGTYLTGNSLFYIKALSCIVDVILAFCVYILVKKSFSKEKALCAFFMVLFVPGIIVNSSLCAQCDVIYTLFIMLFVYFLCINKNWIGLLCYGIALSFKLQAIFIAPIFLYLLITKKIKFYELIYCIFGFIIFNIPSLILGRSLGDILSIYLFQTSEWPGIVRSAPNFYALFFLHYVPVSNIIKLCLIVFVIVLSILIVVYGAKKCAYSNESFLGKITLLSIIVPFFLPGMMDRYFYLANVLLIILFIVLGYKGIKLVNMYLISSLAYVLPVIVATCIGRSFVGYWIIFIATLCNLYILVDIIKCKSYCLIKDCNGGYKLNGNKEN